MTRKDRGQHTVSYESAVWLNTNLSSLAGFENRIVLVNKT